MSPEISSDLVFTSAGEADLASLSVLVNSAYRGDSSKAGWTTEADLLGGQRTDIEGLREQINTPHAEILMARPQNESSILGCVYLKKISEDTSYLGMLTVNPTLQGSGLGKKLLIAGEKWAAKKGTAWIRMTVIAQRPELIAWYEKQGYTKTEETETFPYGDERFGIPQRSDLYFCVLKKRISN